MDELWLNCGVVNTVTMEQCLDGINNINNVSSRIRFLGVVGKQRSQRRFIHHRSGTTYSTRDERFDVIQQYMD